MARTDSKKYKHYDEIAAKLKGKIPEEVTHTNYDGNTVSNFKRVLKIRTIPVAIGIPLDELMFSKFFTNYVTISVMPWDAILTTTSTLVQEARNTIHNLYRNESKAPYLFMLDSDVLPPPDIIERLMAHDKPVIGGYYRKKEKFPIKQLDGSIEMIQRPVVYDYSKYDEEKKHHMYTQRISPKEGLESVDGMGAGCWLIKREVVEAVGDSPYTFAESGEDLAFCRAVHAAGYDVWVDWDTPAGHCGCFWI